MQTTPEHDERMAKTILNPLHLTANLIFKKYFVGFVQFRIYFAILYRIVKSALLLSGR